MKVKKHGFVSGAVILAAFGLLAKIIGAFYRIPLTNLLGAEGMGMYQLVFSIYALTLSMSSTGLPIAISRIVAERNALKKSSAPVLKGAAAAVFASNGAVFLALIFLGGYIAKFQGNEAIKDCYAIIAPSVLFVGGMSLLRGWFQGNMNVVPTAVSQVIEQAVKLAAGLAFARYLMPRGTIYAVYGAVIGVTLSEAAAFVYMIIRYLATEKNRGFLKSDESLKEGWRALTKISFPIALSGAVMPFSQFIDGLLIVNLIKSGGVSTEAATAQYGLYTGTVMSLVNMPIVITLALAIAVVPVVSASRVNRNLAGIVQKSSTAIKLTYVIGMPAALLLFLYARQVLGFLYPALSSAESDLAAVLLRISVFGILFQSQMQIYTSLLQALDKPYVPVRNMLLAMLLKTLLLVLLLRSSGINGAALASLSFAVTAGLLNIRYFNYLTGKNLKLVQNISIIMVSSVIMTLAAMGFSALFGKGITGAVLGALLSALLYFTVLSAFRVFEPFELEGVPLSGLIEKFSAKIRFWENKG